LKDPVFINLPVSNFIKIHPAGATDTRRQTDRDDKGNKHFLQPICLKTQQTIICGNTDT